MEDQQELEKIVTELNLYKNQAEMIQQQVEAIQGSILEIETLETTLADIENKDSLNTLVPIGAGSFVNAEINKTDKIIMSVGAGVAITKTPEEAKETLTTQKNELNDNLNKMIDNLQKISNVINQLTPKAEQLMAKTQGAQNPQSNNPVN
ncbi:prefoldin subunit alpha [Methanobrevibacter filiformis]|uniref:Prefoldin subunit alpha n=1 Tax=Methanobrevibacter filiformis TaxID=55758 RepID=A0A166E2S9_9EURY|nr:prefoldin subunit alpha [Methanobrevibacter filiformis]KZX16216.1 prefoldin subunit alpha [Methanobrevibacter filiformis]